MLLAEHNAAGTRYLIYGPGNTPIYQVTTSGDVMYYHQDHLGSTRLTTNANGTSRGVLTYGAYGETKSNTNPWLRSGQRMPLQQCRVLGSSGPSRRALEAVAQRLNARLRSSPLWQ